MQDMSGTNPILMYRYLFSLLTAHGNACSSKTDKNTFSFIMPLIASISVSGCKFSILIECIFKNNGLQHLQTSALFKQVFLTKLG